MRSRGGTCKATGLAPPSMSTILPRPLVACGHRGRLPSSRSTAPALEKSSCASRALRGSLPCSTQDSMAPPPLILGRGNGLNHSWRSVHMVEKVGCTSLVRAQIPGPSGAFPSGSGCGLKWHEEYASCARCRPLMNLSQVCTWAAESCVETGWATADRSVRRGDAHRGTRQPCKMSALGRGRGPREGASPTSSGRANQLHG